MRTKIFIIAFLILFLFFINSLGTKGTYKNMDIMNLPKPQPEDISGALQNVIKKYGKDIALNVEKIYRLETAHFTSGGFLQSYGAGMEQAGGKPFPYGWTSLNSFWLMNPHLKPVSVIKKEEGGTGKVKPFLVFPSITAGMFAVAEVMKNRNNNAGSWYSNDSKLQQKYTDTLNTIKTPIVNKYA